MLAQRYEAITTKIAAELDRGVQRYRCPWDYSNALARITMPLCSRGIPYRNAATAVALWEEAERKGYGAPIWLTAQQATALGARLRRNQTGTTISATTRGGMRSSRTSIVFNSEQIEGLPLVYYDPAIPKIDPIKRDKRAEAFVEATEAIIEHGGCDAMYVISQDCIYMPRFETFRDAKSYYATLAHELVHWTRHPNRLNCTFARGRGKAARARAEIVAELGSAFLVGDLKLKSKRRIGHAAYIASWLTRLGNDRKELSIAAARAERAVDFLHALQC